MIIIREISLAVGHPIFELASMYNAFVGLGEYDHEVTSAFHGFHYETARIFWSKVLSAYLDTDDPARIHDVEDKARIVGYTRLIRRSIRRKGLETEKGRAEIELWTQELLELLEHVDTLIF